MMNSLIDYMAAPLRELDAFVTAHRDEFAADGIELGEVEDRVTRQVAALERRPYGFALIEPAGPHLWLLWVDPSERGKRLGQRFVREVIDRYASERHMSLYCDGPGRRRFFGRLGFRVESRDGTMRRMTTNPDIHGIRAAR